jgi:hypothetical protein
MKNYPKKYVFIGDRMGNEYEIINGKLQYYLPPRSKGTIFMDIIALAFQKNHPFIQPCNKM